tara:strand:+ start:433 stop:873 length:441 start_codon:yes stop_codon:yes gene_type:complete
MFMRSRPNDVCLACDGVCKAPTHDRSYYYCSVNCSRKTSKGISPLSLGETNENRRRYANNGSQLAMCWYVIRIANHPLSGVEIMDRARDLFGKRVRLKAKSFTHFASYYENIESSKKRGNYYFQALNTALSFKQVLKPRYSQYLYD